MASTKYDGVLNGTKFRLKRQDGAYQRRSVRRELQNNLLTQAESPALTSRGDQPALYQTSWAGGSRWWKPLITAEDLSSYFQANHMDVWSEPGKIVPGNQVVDAANTDVHNNCVIGVADGEVYAIGATANVNAGRLDVYLWTPGSNAFVQETGYQSGVDNTAAPLAMVYDPEDDYFYVITNDNDIERFTPSGTAQNNNWIEPAYTMHPGANIFLQNDALLVYSGNKLHQVDKSGPSTSVVYDDGMSAEYLRNANFTGAKLFRKNIKLAIATPEGVYYVKNTRQGGQPVAWVFRVQKDSAGNWIGNPISTLPVGSIALDIQYHLGQLIISTTPNWDTAFENATQEMEIVLYYVGEGGMGALGSILGGRQELDESPYALLGSQGPLLFIGGQKRLWIYDAIRGGIHTAWEWGTEMTNGTYQSMAFVRDSSGDPAMIFLGRDRIARVKLTQTDDPDTVTNFGDDETHYTLTSNFFDGGLPFELKELIKVAILRDAGDGDQEWTIQLSADGGAFSDALVHATSGETYAEAALSGTTGRQFQYKAIYQTKDTNRNALRALLVSFTTGQLISEWELLIDGTEFLNLDNEPQDPEAIYDAFVALGANESIVTFSDNFQEQDQLTDTATTVNVKVMAVEIVKSTPGEADIRVLLRED